jgi:cell division transport system permease protein
MNKPRGAVRIEPSISGARDEKAKKEPEQKQPPKPRGAKQHKVDLKGHGESWARHHINLCKSSLKR